MSYTRHIKHIPSHTPHAHHGVFFLGGVLSALPPLKKRLQKQNGTYFKVVGEFIFCAPFAQRALFSHLDSGKPEISIFIEQHKPHSSLAHSSSAAPTCFTGVPYSQVYLIHSTRVHLAATALAPWKNKVQWMSHLDSEPNKTTANFYTSASGKEPPVAAPPPSYALGLPPPPRTKAGTAATHRRHRHEAHPRIRIRRPLRPSPRKYEGATTELRRSGGAGAGGDADGDAIASQNKQSRTCYARRQGPALKVAYVSVE